MRRSFVLVLFFGAGCETLVGVESKKSENPRDASVAGSGGDSSGGNAGSNTGGSAGRDASDAPADASGGSAGREASSDAPAETTGGSAGAGATGGTSDGSDAPVVPASECPREFELSAFADPVAIAAGPDGNLWFAESGLAKIGKIELSGRVTEFGPTSPLPSSITAGEDGALWYVTRVDRVLPGRVGRISTSGSIQEWPLDGAPVQIAKGPDGNVWFTYVSGRVGKITSAGEVTSYDVPSPDGAPPGDFIGITSHVDGNLWFVEQRGFENYGPSYIVSATPGGSMREFPLTETPFRTSAFSIVSGPDGALWFTEVTGIGRLTTSGAHTRFYANSYSGYVDLEFDRNGNLWLTDNPQNRLGRMSPEGVYEWFPLPHANSHPNEIALGPDGNLWFVEREGNRIGRMNPACRP